MSDFKKNFCPSPWFHTRINSSGHYEYCRWAVRDARDTSPNIKNTSPVHWFQDNMSAIRISMLKGEELPGCTTCRTMEKHGKISGRQKQLLKIGVTLDEFEKTLISSPWINSFQHSQNNDGMTDLMVQDWQIDLGNFCNSACLFCVPESSTRLAAEYKKMGLISEVPILDWTDDQESFDRFINDIVNSPRVVYLHFIGGETLITPAFHKILSSLISAGINEKVTIGFTTNLTTWDDKIIDLLCKFYSVNLGMSIECLHPLNDYLRYGGQLTQTLDLLDRWVDLAKSKKWFTQIRTTPTIFSIWHLDTIFEYALEKNITVESCNFIERPAFMRPSVLPTDYRELAIKKLVDWKNKNITHTTSAPVVNIRNPDTVHQQLIEDVGSYIDYLTNQPSENHRLSDLVNYIKIMESSRGNRVLDYLPEYEPLLRSVGY